MQRLPIQKLSHGSGFTAQGVRAAPGMLDPFLMVDHYRMSQPTFGPHPHAGFSAVTYMFDDAETGFHNRDSRGDSSNIAPGDLHWTLAGSGVVHDEVPITPGKTAHGLQMFVNLAAKDKFMPPAALHVAADKRPVVNQTGGATLRVGFGSYNDGQVRHAPVVALPTEASLFDISMQAGQLFRYPVPKGDNAFFLVIAGAVEAEGETYAAGQGAAYPRDGQVATISASTDAQVAFFTGTPFNEPVVQHGPFAMSTAEDLAKVMADYQAGRMGHLD